MDNSERSVADTLLDMPSEDFHAYVRRAVRERTFGRVVHTLNEQALRPLDPSSERARMALKRIGFTD